MNQPIIALTMGDPAGIGPEIIMKALASPDVRAICRPLVVGDAERLRVAGKIVDSRLHVESLDDCADPRSSVFAAVAGKVVEDAVEIVGNFRGQLDPRHSYRASFLAIGRRTFLPATRFSR